MEKILIDTRSVCEIDLERFIGTWYEIARYDHHFEKGWIGVTIHYFFKAKGKIKVLGCGFQKTFDGKKTCIRGTAKFSDPAHPGKMKVSFFPFMYNDYYILELEPKTYAWAIVGSASSKYLWILSRTPALGEKVLTRILSLIRARGYSTKKLMYVPQRLGFPLREGEEYEE